MAADPKLDLDAMARFLDAVPEGYWVSYGDVATAGGRSSSAAQGVVSWIGSKGAELSNVHRVLNGRGEVNPAWKPAGAGLPADAQAVTKKLQAEGLQFFDGRADPARRWSPSR